MSLTDNINKIAELGVKAHYTQWEKYLTRKLNYIALIGVSVISLSILSYFLMENYYIGKILIIGLVLFPTIILANIWGTYNLSLYLFYFLSLGLILLISNTMGNESNIYLFFFPLTISIVLLLNKQINRSRIISIFVLLFVFIVIDILGSYLGWFKNTLSTSDTEKVKALNVFFSSSATVLFTLILSRQNAKQENEMNSLIKEKETLLAEVHHRVKNNMTIISSLLNLKKDQCNSNEAKEALEDCKNRVYSMALIHQKVYNNKLMTEINFGDYIKELSNELVFSYSDKEKVKLNIKVDDCLLGLDVAVPCGLIVNELLTNSIKHAMQKEVPLEISIQMSSKDDNYILKYKDNGPGIIEKSNKKESLGLSLISTLSNQLDGKYEFINNNGLEFSLKFKVLS